MKTDGGLRLHPACPNGTAPEKTLLGPPQEEAHTGRSLGRQ